jgi:hypothetical protein
LTNEGATKYKINAIITGMHAATIYNIGKQLSVDTELSTFFTAFSNFLILSEYDDI